MNKSFIDRFYKENEDHFLSLNKTICAVLAVFVLVIVMINTTGCSGNNDEEDVSINYQQEDTTLDKEAIKVGNDGVNAAIAPDEDSEPMVSMVVEDAGRSDPFLPTKDLVLANNNQHKTPPKSLDLVPPPESLIVDSTAVEVVSTKVSGIMYDKFNPSAILNIGGSDYLVRTGDVINSYKVLSIGKESVAVQYGANVYKAGVGELFTGDGINYNTVSNLEKKFGGNKKSTKL